MDLKISFLFTAFVLTASPFSAQVKNGFAFVPGGEYAVGKIGHLLNPYRKVTVDSFFIAKTEVTNRQFEEFVQATGYKTDAERMHNAMVFVPGLKEFEWKQDSSANWKFPNGISRGGIETKMDHPVTTISYTDAVAYCQWAGARLPTLDEWEIACRAGTSTDYFWGDNREQIKKYANIWYGRNHLTADSSDGYMYTSPVGSFDPNPWGLYDVYGNVFELCDGELYGNKKNKRV